MGKRDEVKRIFTHYFKCIALAAGMRWDSDNEAEIEAAVDLVIDAAKEEKMFQ